MMCDASALGGYSKRVTRMNEDDRDVHSTPRVLGKVLVGHHEVGGVIEYSIGEGESGT